MSRWLWPRGGPFCGSLNGRTNDFAARRSQRTFFRGGGTLRRSRNFSALFSRRRWFRNFLMRARGRHVVMLRLNWTHLISSRGSQGALLNWRCCRFWGVLLWTSWSCIAALGLCRTDFIPAGWSERTLFRSLRTLLWPGFIRLHLVATLLLRSLVVPLLLSTGGRDVVAPRLVIRAWLVLAELARLIVIATGVFGLTRFLT